MPNQRTDHDDEYESAGNPWEPLSDTEWAAGAERLESPLGSDAETTRLIDPAARAEQTVPNANAPEQNPYSPGNTVAQPAIARKPRGTARPGTVGYSSVYDRDQRASWHDDRHHEDPSAPRGRRIARSDKPKPPRAPQRAKHGCLSFFLWIAMAVVCAFIAIRFIPSDAANGRMVPELVSFVPLMFIPAIVCLVLSLLWRRRLLSVVCIAALALLAWWHQGYFIPSAQVSDTAAATAKTTASADDAVARIMTLNTANGGASAADVVSIVQQQHVEILCMQELSDGFIAELRQAGLDSILPYYVISDGASSVNNGGRNGIWSMTPLYNTSGNLLPIETSSMPAGTIEMAGRSIRIVSVHPNSPVRGAQDLWDRGLSTIGSLSDYDHTYLIMGDFNSTWDHARFRDLLGTNFVDASEQSGEGFHMTYPSSGRIPSLVEIDHIVYARDSGIVVSELETVAVPGSDHQALLATLEVQS